MLLKSVRAILISFKSVVIFTDFVLISAKNDNTFERNEDFSTTSYSLKCCYLWKVL